MQSIPSKKAEPIKRWLAELTTTNITKEEHPQTMSEHTRVAERGGSVPQIYSIEIIALSFATLTFPSHWLKPKRLRSSALQSFPNSSG